MQMNEMQMNEIQEMHLRGAKDLWRDEEGMGTVEVILIIVVLIGLVILFKKQITSVVNTIFTKINTKVASVK